MVAATLAIAASPQPLLPMRQMQTTRLTLWIHHPKQFECLADDKQFEDCGVSHARCVTPPPIESQAPHQYSHHWAIDRKMQHEWKEDLLLAERWSHLQEATNHFLGKHEFHSPFHEPSSHSDPGRILPLPPMVATVLSWLPGPNPFIMPALQLSIHDTDLVSMGVDSMPLGVPCML
jgi:hypothetical protein